MKSEEIIESWKNQKSLIEIENHFTEKVMNQVYQYEEKKSKYWWNRELFSKLAFKNPLTKFVLVASGVLLGIIRMAFIVCMFLRT